MQPLNIIKADFPETQLSPHAQDRVLDINGKRLTQEETKKRLAKPTPVLVSVSGKMPDQFYLQLSKPDTLIIVLGIPSFPAPKFLPHHKGLKINKWKTGYPVKVRNKKEEG